MLLGASFGQELINPVRLICERRWNGYLWVDNSDVLANDSFAKSCRLFMHGLALHRRG
jgi:hypothetical protein